MQFYAFRFLPDASRYRVLHIDIVLREPMDTLYQRAHLNLSKLNSDRLNRDKFSFTDFHP